MVIGGCGELCEYLSIFIRNLKTLGKAVRTIAPLWGAHQTGHQDDFINGGFLGQLDLHPFMAVRDIETLRAVADGPNSPARSEVGQTTEL